jgi:hypothetical protein
MVAYRHDNKGETLRTQVGTNRITPPAEHFLLSMIHSRYWAQNDGHNVRSRIYIAQDPSEVASSKFSTQYSLLAFTMLPPFL